MLIKCPECELQVSDMAISCPHCGYPMKPTAAPQRRKSSKRRRRLPNGFGQITEIKNKNLRKPFRVMITIGKTDDGRPISKLLKPEAYFETYNEAYEALINYHKDPYSMDKNITLEELYERWSPSYLETLKSPSSRRAVTAAWKYCFPLYNVQIAELSSGQIRDCIDNAYRTDNDEIKYATANTKKMMKSILSQVLNYGISYDVIDKNVAKNFSLERNVLKEASTVENGHMSFTDAEMDKLWSNLYTVDNVDLILIQCYSGWRPQELGLIKMENVDLDNWTFSGGMKTDSGTNRIVPIHSRIRPLVKKRYDESLAMGYENLLNSDTAKYGIELTYQKYRYRFEQIVRELDLDPKHKAHDGRKHFITMAKKYKVDEYAIKRMVGHSINDITEKIYTDRSVEWLSEEIEKIK